VRAYLFDGEPAAAVAARLGYSAAGLNSAVADFRAGPANFFLDARPGPKSAPGKDAARTLVVALRAQGYSIDEIGAVGSNSPQHGGSRTLPTWPPTPAPRCSPGSPGCPRPTR